MDKSNEDCHFFYNSSCSKGSKCRFRHCEAALGCEIVCIYYQKGACTRIDCKFRHMNIKKDRAVIPCKYENQENGCTNVHCPFKHYKARPDPAALPQPDKTIIWEWRNDEDTDWIAYLPEDTTIIEKHHKDGLKSVDLLATNPSLPYIVNLRNMTQANKDTGRTRAVRRREVVNSAFSGRRSKTIIKLPKTWEATSNMETAVIALTAGTEEYNSVKDLFHKTMDAKTHPITKISRVQNPTHWKFYTIRKEEMERSVGEDNVNECQLFHGTKGDAIESICKNNFDFRNSGSSNGSVYGQGTYFATTADHSNSYARTGHQCSMIIARVLCGKSAKGQQTMRKPPPLDPRQPNGPAYNSCVDTLGEPSMFVIFDYSQCYPEYVIEYK